MKECTCNSEGSINNICNVETGACTCKSATITSNDCSTCADHYYGFPTCGGKYYSINSIIPKMTTNTC